MQYFWNSANIIIIMRAYIDIKEEKEQRYFKDYSFFTLEVVIIDELMSRRTFPNQSALVAIITNKIIDYFIKEMIPPCLNFSDIFDLTREANMFVLKRMGS